MTLVVRKYGGSSVATIEKIQFVAQQIKSIYNDGNDVICVVSAMGSTTNELLALAKEISESPNPRELDMLLSIGERKSISLMALALAAIDVPTVSYTGSQVGIITNNNHGNAQILEIKTDRIKTALAQRKVVVVAGFQGVSTQKEITTLGRGGTDTTAVALAAALNADRCELMKDVDGLFNVPPKILKACHLRAEISHSDMIAIAKAGAELIAAPALDLAKQEKITLGIGNTASNYIGTIVLDNPISSPQAQLVSTKCAYSYTSEQRGDLLYKKIFQTDSTPLVVDLHPDHPHKNGIFVSLFYANHLELTTLSDLKPELIYTENNAAYFLFNKTQESHVMACLTQLAELL